MAAADGQNVFGRERLNEEAVLPEEGEHSSGDSFSSGNFNNSLERRSSDDVFARAALPSWPTRASQPASATLAAFAGSSLTSSAEIFASERPGPFITGEETHELVQTRESCRRRRRRRRRGGRSPPPRALRRSRAIHFRLSRGATTLRSPFRPANAAYRPSRGARVPTAALISSTSKGPKGQG